MVDNAAPAAPAASAPASTPAPAAATPVAAAPSPAAAVPSSPATPQAAAPAAPPASSRPTWLPESHWNPTLNALNFEALQKDFETRAQLAARKPEDIKLLSKLPDDFKLPEGATWKVNEKDPYIPELRDLAVKHGLTQDVVNDLMLMDARVKLGHYRRPGGASGEQETRRERPGPQGSHR
jgi:hypothetical protein